MTVLSSVDTLNACLVELKWSASVCFEILQRVRQFIPLGYELQRSVAITEQGWSDRKEQANISRSERVNTNKQVGTCGSEDLIEAN